MFHIRTIGLDILAKLLGNLGIALEQILTCHAGLTGSSSGRHDVFRILESLCYIGGICNIDAFKATMAHLFGHALECGGIGIIQTYIRGEMHHDSCLRHVRANHAGCSDYDELIVGQKFHRCLFFRLSMNSTHETCNLFRIQPSRAPTNGHRQA